MDDTIYALSSGAPPAAIGVIRISGPRAAAVLGALAGRLPPRRRATLRWLRDGAGARLDRALVLWFPGPGSATGEDLAELHIHGGRAVAAVVEAAIAALDGTRRAEPGEFTRRAFANGVIDLAQAEGLADLLAAETETQRRVALGATDGLLSRAVAGWREDVVTASAMVEALLDFADEEDVGGDGGPARAIGARVAAAVRDVLGRPSAERLRDGIRVVIAGPPNAGKSTLLNALAGREAAIATPLPGTTRDLIEVPVAIDGIAFVLTDTAGLRASDDPVETIGIARAVDAMTAADLIVWLGAPDDAPAARVVRVQPRCDLPGRGEPAPGVDLAVSARRGDGLAALAQWLVTQARMLIPREGEASLNARQRAVMADLATVLQEQPPDLLLYAENLRVARGLLDRLVGRAGVEDMLDALFGRFCIGK